MNSIIMNQTEQYIYLVTCLKLKGLLGDLTLTEWTSGWLDSSWKAFWVGDCSLAEQFSGWLDSSWTRLLSDCNVAELSTGWLDSNWTFYRVLSLQSRFLSSDSSIKVLHVLSECTIRVTVLLKYLDHTFSKCSCFLLMFILLLYFSKYSVRWTVHLHISFQPIPLNGLATTVDNLLRKIYHATFTKA